MIWLHSYSLPLHNSFTETAVTVERIVVIEITTKEKDACGITEAGLSLAYLLNAYPERDKRYQ